MRFKERGRTWSEKLIDAQVMNDFLRTLVCIILFEKGRLELY